MKEPWVALLLLAAFLLAPPALMAQEDAPSLQGTWVSDEPILVHVKFSLTFSDSDYLVDCTLGQTIGTYVASDQKIDFTPVKVGISTGDVGKSDTWSYRFMDADSFTLASGPISVKLFRKK